jgi:thiosulfate/3-mercaptopyruvate sulfurtransferase
MHVTHDELLARLNDPTLTILDVRTSAEFSGEAGYPCDARQGHIPGAHNLELEALASCAGPDDVRALVALPAGTEIVAYCHSGSRSAWAVEILRDAGYAARNYPGSWHEWSYLVPELAESPDEP